jgi:hypothetical protein
MRSNISAMIPWRLLLTNCFSDYGPLLAWPILRHWNKQRSCLYHLGHEADSIYSRWECGGAGDPAGKSENG